MKKNYIVVDLDGTIIRTDLFIESTIKVIKQNPLNFFRVVWWLFHGWAYVKDRLAGLVDINVEYLPYELDVLDYLKDKKSQGNFLILATASHKIYAERVASHLGIFDRVLASDGKTNLKGLNKLRKIREIIGDESFIYAGNSAADRPIWKAAVGNIFVNAPRSDVKRAKIFGKSEKVITTKHLAVYAFIKQMRPHQWAKNVLIFIPLFTSHSYFEPKLLLFSLLAFLCFSLCASGVYFLNDLLDLEADRRHKTKRFRPLASGNLSLFLGLVGAIVLPLIAFALAVSLLPLAFLIVLTLYYFLSNAYSLFLKSISTADIMVLAILYTLRIIAGASAVDLELSSWLLAFSMFVFVSLANLKRYIEISSLSDNQPKAHGRGYSKKDSETLFSLGIANITASTLVLALYVSSKEVMSQYQRPEILWFLCFLMLYWSNRIWVGARRGKISDDPVAFALKDSVSRIIGVMFIVTVVLAKYL